MVFCLTPAATPPHVRNRLSSPLNKTDKPTNRTFFAHVSALCHPTRVLCSTSCPCLLDADWCLQPDGVPDSRPQARAAQWLLDAVGWSSKTIVLGMVGDDDAGRALEAGCIAGGVWPMFQRFNRQTHPANHASMLDDLDPAVPPPTGHCAVLTLPTGERSLVGVTGAHKLFDPTGLCDDSTDQGSVISKAAIIYVTAFT